MLRFFALLAILGAAQAESSESAYLRYHIKEKDTLSRVLDHMGLCPLYGEDSFVAHIARLNCLNPEDKWLRANDYLYIPKDLLSQLDNIFIKENREILIINRDNPLCLRRREMLDSEKRLLQTTHPVDNCAPPLAIETEIKIDLVEAIKEEIPLEVKKERVFRPVTITNYFQLFLGVSPADFTQTQKDRQLKTSSSKNSLLTLSFSGQHQFTRTEEARFGLEWEGRIARFQAIKIANAPDLEYSLEPFAKLGATFTEMAQRYQLSGGLSYKKLGVINASEFSTQNNLQIVNDQLWMIYGKGEVIYSLWNRRIKSDMSIYRVISSSRSRSIGERAQEQSGWIFTSRHQMALLNRWSLYYMLHQKILESDLEKLELLRHEFGLGFSF